MRYRLAPILMALDDPELQQVRIFDFFGEFRGILPI